MRNLYYFFILFLSLILVVKLMGLEVQSTNEFLGKWKYESDNYRFVIQINSLSNDTIDATYSIVADNGRQIDIPFNNENNIDFIKYDNTSKKLSIILISQIDSSKYEATLTMVSNNKIIFKLGRAIISGSHIFPYKGTTELVKFD